MSNENTHIDVNLAENNTNNETTNSSNDESATVFTKAEKVARVIVENSNRTEEESYCKPVEGESDQIAPVDRIVLPKDVADIRDEDETIYIIGTKEGKVTKIDGIQHMTQLKTLILRSCLVSSMEGVQAFTLLEKLELYDNQIEYITNIHTLSNLKILDLSFNAIKQLPSDLGQYTPLLEELYVAQNKLKKIEGLQNLKQLKTLDLGANRIRDIEGLEHNIELRSLWLGKNKIEQLQNLDNLTHLEQLDVQNNRLTALGDGLKHLTSLRELYLACNRITVIDFAKELPQYKEKTPTIQTIDLSSNQVEGLDGIEHYQSLEEFWCSGSNIGSFEQLQPLTQLPRLTCLYLEHSPISKDFEYRKRIANMLPNLEQLDATLVSRNSTAIDSNLARLVSK